MRMKDAARIVLSLTVLAGVTGCDSEPLPTVSSRAEPTAEAPAPAQAASAKAKMKRLRKAAGPAGAGDTGLGR